MIKKKKNTKKTCDQKHLGEEKDYFSLQVIVHHQGTSGQELKRGTNAETVDECCLSLAPHGLHSLLSYNTQNHLVKGGTKHNGLGLLHQLSNKRMPPQTLLIGQVYRVTLLAFVKLPNKEKRLKKKEKLASTMS